MLFSDFGLRVPRFLLPREDVDLEKWAVIACDQFTSQPEYWQDVQSYVGNSPSTLNIIYPEAWLSQGDGRIQSINSAMLAYQKDILTRHFSGFEVVWRETPSGVRLGLMAEIDLERYDPSKGSVSLIRATEATVPERIPPRMRIRENATLETPHVLLLVNDPGRTLIEPLSEALKDVPPLYDTPLMMGGGRVKAALVPESLHGGMLSALSGLLSKGQGLLFAVGDGNHSLATAKACWEKLRPGLSADEAASHPARFALVEIENLYDPALRFEPIHRVITGADPCDLQYAFLSWLAARGLVAEEGGSCRFLYGRASIPFRVTGDANPLPLFRLQQFLDEYLPAHPGASIDYVHGADAVKSLVEKGNIGLLLPAMDKGTLFEAVRVGGSLPRKTFSMGSAREKRYYLECRSLAPASQRKE